MSNPPTTHSRVSGRRRIASLVAATAAAALLIVVPNASADAAAAKVTICHQVGNLSYRVITIDVNAVSGGGHGHHDGDIIPAVNAVQGNREIHFPGRNLGTVLRAEDGLTGDQIVANGCIVPALAPRTPATSAAVATSTPTPVSTLAAAQTTAAVPTPSGSAVPTTGVQTTLAPGTTNASRPPTSTTSPTPTLAPSRTVAPDTTLAANCPDGELAHGGECFTVPPLVIPTKPELLTITSQPAASSLTPIVECVDRRSDGITVVWFSYESTADDAVIVARGAANQVTPRGTPPTLFGPGAHIFVLAVETTDGLASWTLAGETAASSADSADCTEMLTTDTTTPETSGTTDPGTTDTTDPGTTGTTDPDTTDPGTTGGPTPTDQCAPGEAATDSACSPVEPVRLVLVDNVLECDGHGIARFAAFNDNVFALETDNATSLVSPARLSEEAPEVIAERDVVSDDGNETAALFTVRYVTAVTWTVSHHGLEASISAGTNGAATNPDCPDAVVESVGAHGLLSAPGPMANTGPSDAVPVTVLATLLSAMGLGLVMLARRREPAID